MPCFACRGRHYDNSNNIWTYIYVDGIDWFCMSGPFLVMKHLLCAFAHNHVWHQGHGPRPAWSRSRSVGASQRCRAQRWNREAIAMQASFLLADEGLWAVRIPSAFRFSSDFGSVQNCPIFRLKVFFSNLDIPSSSCFEFWLPRYRERSAGIPGSRGVIGLNWSRETKNNQIILKWRERERERE